MKQKHSQYPLNFSGKNFNEAQKIIDELHKIPRTGWINHDVKNPESVGEHTDKLIALAEKYFNIPGLSKMLRIHDWPESDPKIGDRRTDRFCPKRFRWTKERKYKAELKAMRRICLSLGEDGDEILNLWLEFEEGKTHRAKIAKELDKIQAIQKAVEYQKQGESVIAQEFISNSEGEITSLIVLQLLIEAKRELKNI
jgi:putative hydrolase of HD superfamily